MKDQHVRTWKIQPYKFRVMAYKLQILTNNLVYIGVIKSTKIISNTALDNRELKF